MAQKLLKDSNKQTRRIIEAIWIRKRGAKVLNRDEGVYSLSHVYDKLLQQQRTVHSVDGEKIRIPRELGG